MRLIFVLAAALSLSACAFGDQELSLAYDTETAKAGLISEAQKMQIAVDTVTDKRPSRKPVGKAETADPKRPYLVGYKRNGYGQNTGNIVNEKPVADVVKTTLEQMLQVNGYSIGGTESTAMLKTEMSDFWFDYKTGLITVEFFGTVEVDVSLVDTVTGEVLFEDSFTGYHSTKTGGGLSGTWTKVMNAAISDLARQISLSPELKDTLDQISDDTELGMTDTGA